MSPEDLVRACAVSNDAEVWRHFFARFHRVIAATVLRTARHWGDTSPQLIDDLVQDAYLKLCADDCRLLRSFEPRYPGAIFGYLKVVTANVVHDHFKSVTSCKRGSGEPEQALDADTLAGNPQSGTPASIESSILFQQIDSLLARSGPDQQRDRVIFWLYYCHGLSARAIASIPSIGLTTKGVESALFRVTRHIRDQIADQGNTRAARAGAKKGFRSAESF
jgi:RNA polymerase sigma-70 factor (ECF subfamily)